MNDLLKKRFRKIIRKHYEDHYTRSFERTKDMYVTMALVDEILNEVTIDDLIPFERMEQIKVVATLMEGMYNNPRLMETQYYFPLVLPKGQQIQMVVTFKENK